MLPTPKRHMGTLCDALVEGRHVSYHCTLERGHEANDEPHYAVEVPKSVRAWQDWHEARSGVLRAQKSPAEQLGSVHTRPPEPAPEPDAPKCGNRLTPILGGEDLLCVRPAGHEAEHTNGFTIWTEVPEERAGEPLSDWVTGPVEANPTDAGGSPMPRHIYQWTGRSPNTCAIVIGDQWCGQGEENEVHLHQPTNQWEGRETHAPSTGEHHGLCVDGDVCGGPHCPPVASTEQAPTGRRRTESEKRQILSEMRPSLSEEGHVMKRLPSSGRCFATLRSPSTSATVLWCEKDWEHEGEHRAGDRTWTVPTKTREGDQRLPDGTGVCVQDVIIAEMEESKRVGLERYGQTLRTFNGRKGIQDVAEELRDAFVYMTQIKTEAAATRNTLVEAVKQALDAEDPMDDVGDRYRAAFAEIAVDRIMGWVVGQRMEKTQTPAYVFEILRGWKEGGDALDFHGEEVPADVQTYIAEVMGDDDAQ